MSRKHSIQERLMGRACRYCRYPLAELPWPTCCPECGAGELDEFWLRAIRSRHATEAGGYVLFAAVAAVALVVDSVELAITSFGWYVCALLLWNGGRGLVWKPEHEHSHQSWETYRFGLRLRLAAFVAIFVCALLAPVGETDRPVIAARVMAICFGISSCAGVILKWVASRKIFGRWLSSAEQSALCILAFLSFLPVSSAVGVFCDWQDASVAPVSALFFGVILEGLVDFARSLLLWTAANRGLQASRRFAAPIGAIQP